MPSSKKSKEQKQVGRKRALLVGLRYNGQKAGEFLVESRGLCSPNLFQTLAAAPLYEYEVIVINPESYSHFIFGSERPQSTVSDELFALKREDNNQDMDTAFHEQDRLKEMNAALAGGTRVINVVVPNKNEKFFGTRSLYSGYLSQEVASHVSTASLHEKSSKRLVVSDANYGLAPYFERLMVDGWRLAWVPTARGDDNRVLAQTPEGYSLGELLTTTDKRVWLVSPPTSQKATNALIESALRMSEDVTNRYHGLFLSHNSEDKAFARQLRRDLMARGVEHVWIDEAEIMIGDSLMRKIQEGIKKSRYFGIVLSPRSIKSKWVERELESAISDEMSSGDVKVLPLVIENCEVPSFLKGKLYADFTSAEHYEANLDKLLRRLQKKT